MRRRSAVVAVVAALGTTVFVVTGGDPSPDDDAGSLVLATESSGVRALDVDLDDSLSAAGPGRFRTAAMDTSSFSMLGVTWSGAAVDIRVKVRTAGEWQAWRELELLTDGPDPGSAEASTARTGTDLQWVGPSDAVQVEVSGDRPDDVSLALISPTAEPEMAGRAVLPVSERRPPIRSRQSWGASASLRTGSPTYNRTIQQFHIHHTVNSNNYSRADVPGLLRGMYRYHTQNLGWSDLGYNFLVDRFGRTWAGRAGGAVKAVRGAHTLGFNDTSTGVAVIGNFEIAKPGRKVITALVQLAAWKLHMYDRAPRGRVVVYSQGSDRFRAGARVRLPVIDGHRDTNETACPGRYLYERIGVVRRRTGDRVARF